MDGTFQRFSRVSHWSGSDLNHLNPPIPYLADTEMNLVYYVDHMVPQSCHTEKSNALLGKKRAGLGVCQLAKSGDGRELLPLPGPVVLGDQEQRIWFQ